VINRSGSIVLALVFMFLSACGGGGGSTAVDSNSTNVGSNTTTDTVAPQGSGTISLKWAAPVSRSDGDALSLSEISNYTIYFGTSVGDYPYSVAIDDPSTTSVDIPDLPAGTYYLVMTATDSLGQESGYSGVAVREVI
jgi:hypothetical protein